MTRNARPLAAAALAALLLAAPACSSDNTSTAATTTAAPATTAASTTAPPTTVDAAKVKTEVSTAYTTFFAKFTGDPALLEDGPTMTAAINSLHSSAMASQVSVTPKDVKPLDDAACAAVGVDTTPCAEVKFDLNLEGRGPVLPDQTGYAVQQDGKWKVGKATLCSLAGLSGTNPPGC